MTFYPSIPSPCYVLEENLLKANLELLRRVQQDAGVEIICALKGFSFYHEFPLVKQYLDGATASSLHEARLAFEEMQVKSHVYSPAYLDREFDRLYRCVYRIMGDCLDSKPVYANAVFSRGVSSCAWRILGVWDRNCDW